MKNNILIDTFIYSGLSCGLMYFIGKALTHKELDYPLSLIMVLGILVGLLHLSENIK